VLEPEKAVRLLVDAAEALGATIHAQARVRRVTPKGDGVMVELESGETVEAGAAIIAAGPWIGELVPELKPHLTLTRQTQTWFAPVAPALVAPGRMPAFLLDTGEAMIYGLPDICGNGVKAGLHGPEGVLDDADAPRVAASAAETAALRRVLERLVPAAAGVARRSTSCVYRRTPA
jgi:sarcosine oxidase